MTATTTWQREWDELAQQLLTLPGSGPAGILNDFFGSTARPAERPFSEQERWELDEGGTLSLETNGALMHYDTVQVATLLAHHAGTSPPGVSPLALMLAALAGGLLDDQPHPAAFKALKNLSPKLARSAQELLLVASCRLCG